MPETNRPDFNGPDNSPERWPAPTPRDEMLARVLTRGRRIRMINRILLGIAITAGVGAGAAGVALGYSGNGPFSSTPAGSAPMSSQAAPYYLCPADGHLGRLSSGDRVYLTGIDESGVWVQLRAPGNPDDRVWVERRHVDPDRELELPTASCTSEMAEFERVDGTTTTTAPEPDDDPEEPDGDTGQPDGDAEEPPATTGSTTTSTTSTTSPSTTTSTPAPPTTTSTTTTQPAPVLGAINRNPATITEQWSNICGGPHTSSISVPIANATSATMSWDVGPMPRSVAMTRQGNVFSAELGPFDESVVSSGHVNITVTVTATGPGGQRSSQTTVRLNDCYFG